jgi:SH3 domain-containing YSC84-like protein 1
MKSRFSMIALLAIALPVFAATEEEERLNDATTTLNELAGAADKGIPADLLNKSVCTVVIPGVKKGGFIVGGKYGRGFASCRDGKGGWSAPAGMRMEGSSVGLQ